MSSKTYSDSPFWKLCSVLIKDLEAGKKFVLGRLLTIADATTADVQQREALKSVIREAMYSYRGSTREIVMQFGQKYYPEEVKGWKPSNELCAVEGYFEKD